ncbi:MAG: hypothetical protein JXR73_10000 [Candidatus Omnitrophica bacterium]|nr:hypothetical protein [Candidatus Omnitrophota bacterium]
MMNVAYKKSLLLLGGLSWLAFLSAAHAGIPEPPMIVYGNVVTEAGAPAPLGNLTFQFTDSQENLVLSVEADMASVNNQSMFMARIPIESQIAEKIQNALTLGAQYRIAASYNGSIIESQELSAQRGAVLGPIQLSLAGDVGNPPTLVSIEPSSAQIGVGESVKLTIVAEDLDGDVLTFDAQPLAYLGVLSFIQTGVKATMVVEYYGTEQNQGVNQIKFTVSDGAQQDSKTVTITVGGASPSFLPDIAYEFNQNSLAANGWGEIPGGFIEAPPAAHAYFDFSVDPTLIPSSADRKGLVVNAQAGQVSFFYALNALQTPNPVLLRLTARANSPDVQIALAALKGNASTGEVDGSIATHIPATSANLIPGERQLTLIYEPDGASLITPAFQVAAGENAPMTTVLIDRLEAFDLSPARVIPAAALDSISDSGVLSPPAVLPNLTPDYVYEFDQNSVAECGWLEILGGFNSAPWGYVQLMSLTNAEIPSSADQKGLGFLTRSGEVNFIYTAQPFDTQGYPVLLRAAVQSDNPNAQCALVALKGNLATFEGVDASIATNIPYTMQNMAGQESILQIIYEPDSGSWITPAVQVAGMGDQQQAKVMIDRLEIYRLNSARSYPGGLFQSGGQ